MTVSYTHLDVYKRQVYTGPIDAYFDYKLGTLEYRSVRFENELLDKPSFQGNAAVNYTDRETPWTRIIEHKWFEFGKDENGNDLPKTIISREYSSCLLYTSHEVGIASNRGSACRGEYVPGPCTHRPSHHESRGDPKSVV